MDNYYDYRFSGMSRLYGQSAALKLQKSHVLIVGLGGVGSWAVEALARSGLGALTLVDFDDICTSNFNRQIHALDSTVGLLKSEVLKKRILQINKDCQVHVIDKAYNKENEDQVFCREYDYAIDAIDTSLLKEYFIVACKEKRLPLTIVGATGGRKDPSKIRIADLSQTTEDVMLGIIRKNLRRNYNFPRGKEKFKIPAIYSIEKPIYPSEGGCVSQQKSEGNLKALDCQNGMGAASFLTGTVAFHAAAMAISHLTQEGTTSCL